MEIDLSDYTKVLRNQNAYKNGNINGKLTIDALQDLSVEDTETVDLTLTGNTQKTLTADTKIANVDTNAISIHALGGLYVQDFGSEMADVIARLGELDYKFTESQKVNHIVITQPDNLNLTGISASFTKQGRWVQASLECHILTRTSWINIVPFPDGYKPLYVGDVQGYMGQNSINLATNAYDSAPFVYCNNEGFKLMTNFSNNTPNKDLLWKVTLSYVSEK